MRSCGVSLIVRRPPGRTFQLYVKTFENASEIKILCMIVASLLNCVLRSAKRNENDI